MREEGSERAVLKQLVRGEKRGTAGLAAATFSYTANTEGSPEGPKRLDSTRRGFAALCIDTFR